MRMHSLDWWTQNLGGEDERNRVSRRVVLGIVLKREEGEK
jgi:hypothetical protein